jgi:hypothetical protein
MGRGGLLGSGRKGHGEGYYEGIQDPNERRGDTHSEIFCFVGRECQPIKEGNYLAICDLMQDIVKREKERQPFGCRVPGFGSKGKG